MKAAKRHTGSPGLCGKKMKREYNNIPRSRVLMDWEQDKPDLFPYQLHQSVTGCRNAKSVPLLYSLSVVVLCGIFMLQIRRKYLFHRTWGSRRKIWVKHHWKNGKRKFRRNNKDRHLWYVRNSVQKRRTGKLTIGMKCGRLRRDGNLYFWWCLEKGRGIWRLMASLRRI